MDKTRLSPRLGQALETMSKLLVPEELTYDEMLESMDRIDAAIRDSRAKISTVK